MQLLMLIGDDDWLIAAASICIALRDGDTGDGNGKPQKVVACDAENSTPQYAVICILLRWEWKNLKLQGSEFLVFLWTFYVICNILTYSGHKVKK